MPLERVGVLGLAALLVVAGALVRRRERLAVGLSLAAAAILLLLVGVRCTLAGRPPVFGTYEMNLAQALTILAMAPWVTSQVGGWALRGPTWVAAATLAYTAVLRIEVTPQTISELSLWIDAHAVTAWVAWGCYAHAGCLAFAREERAEQLALRLLGWGFLAHSALIFTGVYYATVLFATPWAWDPIQILGLLSWLLYAMAIHFRLFSGVTLRRQRWFLALLLLVFALSAKLIMWLPFGASFHVFELGGMAGGQR